MFVYMNDFWLKKKKRDFVGYWATKSQARFKTVERKGEKFVLVEDFIVAGEEREDNHITL
jgi:hypothetical protein